MLSKAAAQYCRLSRGRHASADNTASGQQYSACLCAAGLLFVLLSAVYEYPCASAFRNSVSSDIQILLSRSSSDDTVCPCMVSTGGFLLDGCRKGSVCPVLYAYLYAFAYTYEKALSRSSVVIVSGYRKQAGSSTRAVMSSGFEEHVAVITCIHGVFLLDTAPGKLHLFDILLSQYINSAIMVKEIWKVIKNG